MLLGCSNNQLTTKLLCRKEIERVGLDTICTGDSQFCFSLYHHQPDHCLQNLLRCSWSPDGSKVAGGSGDRFVYVWDTTSRRITYKLPGHAGSVNDVDFHPFEPVCECFAFDLVRLMMCIVVALWALCVGIMVEAVRMHVNSSCERTEHTYADKHSGSSFFSLLLTFSVSPSLSSVFLSLSTPVK